MSWGRGRGNVNNAPAWMSQQQQQQQQHPPRDDRLGDEGPGDRGGGGDYRQQQGGYYNNNNNRGGGPPRGGGGGGPPYRGGNDNYNRGPPFYDDRGGGPPGGGAFPPRVPYNGGGGGGYGGPPPPPRDGGWGGGGPPRGGDDHRGGGGPPGQFRGGGRGGGGQGGPPPPVGPGNGRPGMPGAVTFRSMEEEREWVEERRRKRLARPTKFDILPTAGTTMTLPTGEVVAVPMNPYQQQQQQVAAPMITMDVSALLDTANAAAAALAGSQQTRHARRLYVGNLPVPVTEDMIHQEFKRAIGIAWDQPEPLLEDPILSVYINHERRFCFLEFKTMEMATACMNLDGLILNGQALKIKRPNDYNETTMGPGSALAGNNPIPMLDVSRLGIISGNVLDGPNKVFIGGLHYHLTEQQVLELLQAFGKVKAFHLVKGGGAAGSSGDSINSSQINDGNLSKGYCFVEYADGQVTATAIAGLNGMEIGSGKSITARLAGERAGGMPVMATTPTAAMPQLQQQQMPYQQQQQQAPFQQQQHFMAMSNLPGAPPPDRNIVGGYDVEALVDAAMGNAVMPTAPMYMDALGQPLTRIVHILPPSLPQMILPPVLALPPLPPAQPMEPPTMASAAPTPAAPQIVLPDRVLVLHNMVQDEDLSTAENHAALLEEVRDECRKYGNLLAIQIPRIPDPPLVQATALGKIYLEYATPQDANAARAELQGRQFGDAVVEVSIYPQMDFTHGKLV